MNQARAQSPSCAASSFTRRRVMSFEHPGIDHAVVNSDFHGSRVCIVPASEAEDAVIGMKLLFPHESILTTPIGREVCVYTDNAPASLVAERISLHLQAFNRAA